MTPSVSVVIPTIGRPTLARAVQSALGQSVPAAEIIVVVDTDKPVSVPADSRIMLLYNGVCSGPARCRQRGIDAASGSVIALLDDDDEWYPDKLERQLAAMPPHGGTDWIASSRTQVLGPGTRRRTWPRRLIDPGQSVTEYLFRRNELCSGGALLQSSTLVFPIDLARRIRWDGHSGAAHDELSWLIAVQRSVPSVRWIQLPEVLGVYNVTGASVSRAEQDLTDHYIDWGLENLSTESPRILGDYLCTSPVSAAVAAGSVAGVRRSLRSARRHGRPGPFATVYAVMSGARIAVRSPAAAVRR